MTPEKFTCREGNESDLEGVADLFRRHNYGPKDAEWVRWKYLENPDGRAWIYLVEDAEGSIVAVRAQTPRHFTSDTTGTFLAGQAVDLFVAEELRGLGIHSQLREFMRDRMDYPVFGIPNKLSKHITRNRPGDVRIYYPVDEWVYPIVVRNLIQNKPYGFVSPIANVLSKIYASLWLVSRQNNLQMIPVSRFEKDYELDRNFIHGIRSAAFLNWRFIDNPMQSYSCYEFLDEDRPIGYCVLAVNDSKAEIYDLVLGSRGRGCLRLLVEHCRSRGIGALIFKSVGFRMRRFGFVKRASERDFFSLNTPAGRWLVTLGDKD